MLIHTNPSAPLLFCKIIPSKPDFTTNFDTLELQTFKYDNFWQSTKFQIVN